MKPVTEGHIPYHEPELRGPDVSNAIMSRGYSASPGQDPYDPNGLQTLCRACHIAKTARDNRRPPTPAELAWRDLVAELVNDNP